MKKMKAYVLRRSAREGDIKTVVESNNGVEGGQPEGAGVAGTAGVVLRTVDKVNIAGAARIC